MLDWEQDELDANPQWQQVLAAYLAEQDRREPPEDGEIWLPRIATIDGVQDEHLPRIHGKLIASGFLKFQLAGRVDGVQYQVSTQGKTALAKLQKQEPDVESDGPGVELKKSA